jgi:drug/metabolite transporter (DMT)-like permease
VTPQSRALWLGLVAVGFWSTAATAFKIALAHLDIFQLLFYASLTSSVVLLPVLAWRGSLSQLGPHFRQSPGYFLLVSAMNPCLYYLVLFSAYDLLPAQQAQAINYTWAIVLALLAVPLLGHRLHWTDGLAALMGYLGVLIIATRGDLTGLQFTSLPGVGLALLSTLVWAGYWILGTRSSGDSVVAMTLNFLLATPLCLALCLLFSSPWIGDWRGLAAAGYVGAFEMGITFVIWSIALKTTSRVALVGNLIFLAPFLSLFFIQGVLGESIHPATLVGLMLIVPGALLQQLRRGKAPG